MAVGTRSDWGRRITPLALVLAVGAVAAALIGAVGAGRGLWHFRVGFEVLHFAFWAAAVGGVLGLLGLVLTRGRAKSMLGNLVALVVAAGFLLYVGSLIRTAKAVPAIHDATTNLEDVPKFERLAVRSDNLEKIPGEGRPDLERLAPEARWKAVHRLHYADLHTLRLAADVPSAVRRAAALARDRGWTLALVDAAAGQIEATATSRFFRFKDDIAIRVRPAPGGGSVVDMRSVSRVGQSDLGVNAARVRAFMADLARSG
jgi:Protein of unknown function (DUF1499)